MLPQTHGTPSVPTAGARPDGVRPPERRAAAASLNQPDAPAAVGYIEADVTDKGLQSTARDAATHVP